MLFNSRLKTKQKLLRCGIPCSAICNLCYSADETSHHLLVCNFIMSIWDSILGKFGHVRHLDNIWDDHTTLIASRSGRLERLAASLALPAVIWHCWHERNMRIFQNCCKSATSICFSILQDIRDGIYFLLSNDNLCKAKGSFLASWDLPPASGTLINTSLSICYYNHW